MMNTATLAATPASADTDRIERNIHIKAPRSKVWRSLSNAEDYGTWFGANLKGKTFAPGERVQGNMTIKGYEHVVFDAVIERLEPESLMSYRWHPHAIEAGVDYSKEERTLVTFTLAEADGGTLLTVTETGFDKVPPARRMTAFHGNSKGWAAQLDNINKYVTHG